MPTALGAFSGGLSPGPGFDHSPAGPRRSAYDPVPQPTSRQDNRPLNPGPPSQPNLGADYAGQGRGRGAGGAGNYNSQPGGNPFRKQSNIICNTCGESGHKSSTCPSAICHACGNYGHMKYQCPNRAQPGPSGAGYGHGQNPRRGFGGGDGGGAGGVGTMPGTALPINTQSAGPPLLAPRNTGSPAPASSNQPLGSTPSTAATALLSQLPFRVIPFTGEEVSPDEMVLESRVQHPKDLKDTSTNSILDHMHKHGLRTGFGTDGDRESEVLTNYLEITERPALLFVYKIILTRCWDEEGKPVYVKNKFDKQGLFEHMKTLLPQLNTSTCWVTDYDMIWSTKPLFHEQEFDLVPTAMTNVTATNPNNFKQVTVEEAQITYAGVIYLRKTVGEAFRNPADRLYEANDPEVLVRGLNAIVTDHARGQTPADLISSGAGKFYETDWVRNLSSTVEVRRGFSASIRPGAQQILLNISPKYSPFLKAMTVQQFVDLRPNITRGKLLAILKGVKVKILYHTSDLLSDTRRRVKFITGIGKPLKDQEVNDTNKRNGIQTLKDYYEQDLFVSAPLKPLNLETLAINVGGKPTKDTDKKSDGRVGSTKRQKKQEEPEWYPPEYLQIVGYPTYHEQLSGHQTSAMIRQALQTPQKQQEEIETRGTRMFGIDDGNFKNRLKNDFALSIKPELCKVPCRFLDAPQVRYGRGIPDIRLASWNLSSVQQLASLSTTARIPLLDLTALRDPNAKKVDHKGQGDGGTHGPQGDGGTQDLRGVGGTQDSQDGGSEDPQAAQARTIGEVEGDGSVVNGESAANAEDGPFLSTLNFPTCYDER